RVGWTIVGPGGTGKGPTAHLWLERDPATRRALRNNARLRRALLVPILALAFVPHAASGPLPLPTRLANALAVRGNSPADSGAVAIDLQNGRVLFERNADLSLEPASNEKLTVTFAALRELGAAYRFRTEVL